MNAADDPHRIGAQMRNPGPTSLSNDHSQKAKMVASRLRAFIDAMQGRSKLKIGPHSIVLLMDDAATLFEHMNKDKSSKMRAATDEKFMVKHPNRYFIRHGGILVHKDFLTRAAAEAWARNNYRGTQFAVVTPRQSPMLE